LSRERTLYFCADCGGESPKWQGRCPHCGAWNTLVEQRAPSGARRHAPVAGAAGTSRVQRIASIETRQSARLGSGQDELDRVLGGGFVEGAVILLGGDPGIGKSTLLLQSLAALGASRPVLYVTGEESPAQVALRAERLGLLNAPVDVLAEIRIEAICEAVLRAAPEVVVVDSIQTVYSEALESAPGSVSQVRECAARLTRLAKEKGIAVVLVGHVTKEGAIAGPRVLEHMVDTVLYFEGETHSSFRVIRAIKNRFGAVNELGVFAMTDRGLKGVSNPSALFVASTRDDAPGRCVLPTLEGTRPLLVEIQALVAPAVGGVPRRLSVGMDTQRLALLLAALQRHCGIATASDDVFVNAVGGVRVGEPAADLAALISIVSSIKNKPLRGKTVVFGEVGLTGEIRPVQRGQERLKEAAKLGYRRALIPNLNNPKQGIDGIEVVATPTLSEAVEAAFP
jgi:DNA repair protein RadA/Sms